MYNFVKNFVHSSQYNFVNIFYNALNLFRTNLTED